MNLRGRGIAQDDIHVMLMRNLGLELYGNGIIVDSEYAAKNQKIVQGLCQGHPQGAGRTRLPTRRARSRLADEAECDPQRRPGIRAFQDGD